jgi:Tol biopolymer transport system component/DNA-binding winged helix-turn-helix (wHTH) protein
VLTQRARTICYRSGMEAAPTRPAPIRFGDSGELEADLYTEELRRSGRAVRLPKQSFLVLALLLQSGGQLVTRDELRKRLWPKETYIEYDQALNAAVNRLREALGDSADRPRYVETLPRRGYRFIGKIATDGDAPLLPASAVEAPARSAQQMSSGAGDTVDDSAPRRGAATGGTSERARPGVGWRLPLGVVAVVSIVVLVGALALLHARLGQPHAEFRLTPFTSLPNREISPTFSPDGNALAFAWNGTADDSHGFDLYVKHVDSEKLLRLTQRPAQWLSPAWSHDGRQIAFARVAGADSGIFVVSALGGDERRIVSVPIAETALMQLAWSADDRALVYPAFGAGGNQVLFRLPLDSPTPQPLNPALSCWDMGDPSFSPDGSQLAFICMTSVAVYSIHTMRADGTGVRKLADANGYPAGIAWSTDGSRIVFANDSGDGGGLWEVTLDGTVSRLPFGEDAASPAVALKGDRLAYVRTRQVVNIWRVDLQATPPEQSAARLISSTRVELLPQYSPDGAHIAFQSNRSGSWEIWVSDADGTQPVRISSFNGPITGAVSWCTDGKRLAFDSRASGTSALYVADVDERRPRLVKTSVTNLALPVWSRNCEWLIASGGNSASYLIPAAGGAARRFTTKPSYYASLSGNRAVFNVKAASNVVLWQKQIGATEEQPLTGLPALSYSDLWAASDRGVYFTLGSEDARLVRFYDFNTHDVRPIVRLPQAPPPLGGLGLSVSRDDRFLLFAQTEDQESDVMLMSRTSLP